MMFAVARVLVNALVIVCCVASLTCPEMAVCVSGNADAVYSRTINARCIPFVQHFYNIVYQLYNMCIPFVEHCITLVALV